MFYLIQIPLQYQELLYSLQAKWNFELAFQGECVFLRTEEAEMLEESSVRSIPGLKLWVLKKGMLFGIRDLLPTKVAPEFIWQYPEETLKLRTPDLNHNYFGLGDQRIELRLRKSDIEQSAVLQLVDPERLMVYLDTNARRRWASLTWINLPDYGALIKGEPLLPLPGTCYWDFHGHFLPLGFEYEIQSAAKSWIGANKGHRIWIRHDELLDISGLRFMKMGRASFKLNVFQGQ